MQFHWKPQSTAREKVARLSETIPIEQHVESVFSIHSLNQQELFTNPQSVGLQIDEYTSTTARKQRCQQLINLWITQFIDKKFFLL